MDVLWSDGKYRDESLMHTAKRQVIAEIVAAFTVEELELLRLHNRDLKAVSEKDTLAYGAVA
jgi:hypothetical protein